VVHPLGTLTVKETVVPLDLAITRYGNTAPSDGNYFSISKVQISGTDETATSFQDYFAAGQFLTLSDADKLSRPSFERYDAGVKIGSAAVVNGADSARTVTYKEHKFDTPQTLVFTSRVYAMPAAIHGALIQQGAGFVSPVKTTGLAKYANGPARAAVSAADASYVVAATDDLSIRSDIASSSGLTYFHARAALAAYSALHPEEAAGLQIVPLHEVSL